MRALARLARGAAGTTLGMGAYPYRSSCAVLAAPLQNHHAAPSPSPTLPAGHCSALIKVTGDLGDLLLGHLWDQLLPEHAAAAAAAAACKRLVWQAPDATCAPSGFLPAARTMRQ